MVTYRKERVGELLLEFLAGELRQFSDPRIAFVTIMAVKVSPDLKNAYVYWSALNDGRSGVAGEELDDNKIADISKTLAKVSTALRRRIGSELKLRYTPELHFRFDEVTRNASRIDDLLAKVSKQ